MMANKAPLFWALAALCCFASFAAGQTCETKQYFDGATCLPCPVSCSTCTSATACTSAEQGYWIDQGLPKTCSSTWGDQCALCNATHGCTFVKHESFYVKPITTATPTGTGIRGFAVSCYPDFGANCYQCNATHGCTADSLRFPSVGATCANRRGDSKLYGAFCTEVNSRCTNCICNGTALACTGTTGIASFYNIEGKLIACNDTLEGFGTGCNNCNATSCLSVDAGYYLVSRTTLTQVSVQGRRRNAASGLFPASCPAHFGEGCTACNAGGCTAVATQLGFYLTTNRRSMRCSDAIIGCSTCRWEPIPKSSPLRSQLVCSAAQAPAYCLDSNSNPEPVNTPADQLTLTRADSRSNQPCRFTATYTGDNTKSLTNKFTLTLGNLPTDGLQYAVVADFDNCNGALSPFVLLTRTTTNPSEATGTIFFQCNPSDCPPLALGTCFKPDHMQITLGTVKNNQFQALKNRDEACPLAEPTPSETPARRRSVEYVRVQPKEDQHAEHRRQSSDPTKCAYYGTDVCGGIVAGSCQEAKFKLGLTTITKPICKCTWHKKDNYVLVEDASSALGFTCMGASKAKFDCNKETREMMDCNDFGCFDGFYWDPKEQKCMSVDPDIIFAVPLRNDQFDSNINLEPTNTNQLDSLPEISEKCEVHSLGDEYKPDHCSKATFSTALAADSDYKKVFEAAEASSNLPEIPSEKDKPLCYVGLDTGSENEKSCFCHRTCSLTNTHVPVIVDSFSAHCEAMTINYLGLSKRENPTITGDYCCKVDPTANGRKKYSCPTSPPSPGPGPAVTIEVLATTTCCATPYCATVTGRGCQCITKSGDPHFNTPDGTSYDNYAKGGPYRLYDIMVWDDKLKRTERMTIDSMFTVTESQTYMNTVEFAFEHHRFSFNFLSRAWTANLTVVVDPKSFHYQQHSMTAPEDLETKQTYSKTYNEFITGDEGLFVFTDYFGEPVFEVRATISQWEIMFSRDPSMYGVLNINNREFRMQMKRPASDLRYQWYAVAGLDGLFFPIPVAPLSDIDRRRNRLNDLIDRAFWENWASQCLASTTTQRCDTSPLTALPVPSLQRMTLTNGTIVELGPPTSAFQGWLGNIALYGADAANQLYSPSTSVALKSNPMQRCFINEFAQQWHRDLWRFENVTPDRLATEHTRQCFNMNNAAIDALYRQKFPNNYQIRTTTTAQRRNAKDNNGKGPKTILDEHGMRENVIPVFQSSAGPDSKLKNQLFNRVLHVDGNKFLEVLPASNVPVSMSAGGKMRMNKGKFFVKELGKNVCHRFDENNVAFGQSDCRETANIPLNKYTILVKEGSSPVWVDSEKLNADLSMIQAHFAGSRRTTTEQGAAGDLVTDYVQALTNCREELKAQDGCTETAEDVLAKLLELA